jgi:zinc/manganese transport system substrate-binding protein
MRALLALLLSACTLALPAKAAEPLNVVASFSILADLIREVGGDAVTVTALVGPNSDAHVFEPSPQDARRVRNAELVAVNGLHFEGWIDRLIVASGYRGPLLTASERITPLMVGGEPDPHVWQSLANVRRYIDSIEAALSAARPAETPAFAARADRYRQALAALDREADAALAAVPRAERRIVTSHDAFAYFAAERGLEVLSPQGWTTESEASAATVARLIGQLRAQRVRAVFVENITDPRLVQRIAAEAGAVVGGTLYSDALSPPGTEADSYLKLYRHNLKVLAAALSATGSAESPASPSRRSLK